MEKTLHYFQVSLLKKAILETYKASDPLIVKIEEYVRRYCDLIESTSNFCVTKQQEQEIIDYLKGEIL